MSDEHEKIQMDQYKRITGMFIERFPMDMPLKIAKDWAGGTEPGAFEAAIRKALIVPPEEQELQEKLKAQEKFWRQLFPGENFRFNPARIAIWPRKPGHDRLLVMPAGQWGNRLYDKSMRLFPCLKERINDLDGCLHLSGSPSVSTARWFRDRREADQEYSKESVEFLDSKMRACITIPERLLYELVYFAETGEHLDQHNLTLACGSRIEQGNSAGMQWRDNCFVVRTCARNMSHSEWRARSAA
jgi:hypothetical protein